MGLEDKLRILQERHYMYRRILWFSARLFYHAQGFGSRSIEGPALVVFDSHEFSTDAMMPSYIESYLAMVARQDRTPFSFLAHYGGGPTFKERNSVPMYLFKQLRFLLQEGQVVGLFPFTDVHNGKPAYLVIEAAMNFERKEGLSIKYVAAAIHNSFAFASKPPRIWPSYWPLPFLTSSKIMVSNNPIFSSQLPADNRSAEHLVALLQKESEALRVRYVQK